MSVMERFSEVKRLGLCINCLNKGHSVKNCRSSSCRVCQAQHNTLLHRFEATPNRQQTNDASAESTTSPELYAQSSQASLHSSNLLAKSGQVILATAVVDINRGNGQLFPIRILLDSASQLNFIASSIAKRLHLKQHRVDAEVTGIGYKSSTIKYSTSLTIKSRLNNFETRIDALVLNTITGVQPESRIDTEKWRIPDNIQLADPNFHTPTKIDALLGAEIFYQLLSVGQIKLGINLPILQKTLLGWIVAGPLGTSNHCKEVSNVVVDHSTSESFQDALLVDRIEKFWKVEEVKPEKPNWNQEQIMCEQHFIQTTTRDTEGRFVVKLPFKRSPSELGESYNAAYRSFIKLESRLSAHPLVKQQYIDFMREYENLGHMRPSDVTNNQVGYFIPHRCVMRPESSSTKLRVVFNASCPTSTNVSLNDTLMVGPVIQNDLYNVIIRFRCYNYVATGDISKMYRQVRIAAEDQKYLGILWRNEPSKPIRTYLLSTVTYGTAPASYQATRCLNSLADEYDVEYPLGAQAIKSDFYVDDLITGADSIDELKWKKFEVVKILSAGKFELRKWSSNCRDFIKDIPPEEREPTLCINDSEVVKTVGLIWDPKCDNFQYTWNTKASSEVVTKRSILSQISSLFDPLGLISPFLVRAKLIMQKLWSLKLDWDESLPLEIHCEWLSFREQLAQVTQIRIPRHIYPASSEQHQIHGFADASSKAYGCCIYVRSINSSGEISVQLLTSKSRVAPLKTQSLTRLELCAALLLAQLLNQVRDLVKHTDKIYLWTDSTIVLHWISGEPSSWTTFVANRVSKIQQQTDQLWWHHVDSKANPADIVSRGANLKDLLASKWFRGPEFLYSSQEAWPNNWKPSQSISIPEKRQKKAVLVVRDINPEIDVIATHKHVNNYSKLCRIFVHVHRFVNQLKERRGGNMNVNKNASAPGEISAISPEEFENAQRKIVYYIQNKFFQDEIQALQKGKQIKSSSPIKVLCPFLDDQSPKLLRVGGRLRESNLPYNSKFPILLPRAHPFSRSYLTHLHKKLFHAGPLALVAASRQEFWILNAKNVAYTVVRKCIHCFHYRPRTMQQVMGNLPSKRLEPSPPFATSGVDFCGPVWITSRIRGRPLKKAYIALFVCFATKAVHLEVVSDLSSEAFILALKRFIARRGPCNHLFCDNATNFAGAKTKLAELYKAVFNSKGISQIHQSCTDYKINFHFIPPRSPHFGGLWESSIKMAKHHLYRAVHKASLSFEEMSTFVAQVEAILNSRPISAMSASPSDEEVLTPGHFLVGRQLTSLPEPSLIDHKVSPLNRWQHVRALQQHFWRRWSHEYLTHLQQRYKWTSSSPDVKVNTLVLIADDQQSPQHWAMGRIIRVFPGNDGHVRVAEVKTAHGILRRSITKLAPLPLDEY